MLNRKFSNYLFYFVLFAVAALVVVVRIITIGNLDDKIADLKINNLALQAQIRAIEEIVEDNNDVQIDHLYELYSQVPNYLSVTELSYYTTAQLELVGITELADMQREVLINQSVTFSDGTLFSDLQDDFRIVEVKVYFTTQDDLVIEEFLDLLYNADQVFIVNHIEYSSPDGENYIGVSIDFLGFYEKQDES